MKIISTTDLRQNLQDVVDEVFYKKEPVIVFRRKKARVILAPLPEGDKKIMNALDKYEETLNKIKLEK